MCTSLRNGSIIATIATASFASAIWVGGVVGGTTTKWYVYEFESNNVVTKGFACKCKILDGQPRWLGKNPSNCSGGNLRNTAFKITDVPSAFGHPVDTTQPVHQHGTNTTPIAPGACCRTEPHATGMNNLNVPDDGDCL